MEHVWRKIVQMTLHVKSKKNLKVTSQRHKHLSNFKKRLAQLRVFEICVSGNSRSPSVKMAEFIFDRPQNYTTSYEPVIVSVALACTIFKLVDVE